MRFKGRVVIVTGASRGMGLAIARAFAKGGASLVLTGRDSGKLEESKTALDPYGQKVLIAPADLRSSDSIRAMVAAAIASFGRIDVLVNNAGGSLATPNILEELSEEDWDAVVDTNLKAVFTLSQAVLPHMREQRYGRLVHIGSVAGRTISGRSVGLNYCAAKAGLGALSREIALEYGGFNITSNVVAPGFIVSSELALAKFEMRPEEVKRALLQKIVLGRPGTPEEVSHAVAFIASSEAEYITGATLDVNGGMFMG